MARYLYSELAMLIQARINCAKPVSSDSNQYGEWYYKHSDEAYRLTKEYMPSGSGIDCGTKLQINECTANKLVFTADFHHMDENGFYDGWTHHRIVVFPSLQNGFNLRISGRDRNQIKDYLYQVYDCAMRQEVMAHSETQQID